MTSNKKIIGSLSQEELIEMYSTYVNKYKASFFQDLGFGVIQGERNGLRIKSLEGIEDKKSLEWIDCRTSGGVFNLGHRHPVIIQALIEGLEAGLDIGDHHLLSEQRSLLARDLAKILPGNISKTQFSVGGGEAIDLAIKLARGITKRKKIISAKKAYHGVTGFALGTGADNFKKPFLWDDLPEFQQIDFGNIDQLRKTIDEDTACVIFETIPATGGILIAPEGYFAEVRELCDKYGVIMIADEVQTGLGRTGELWGIHGGLYPNEKVVPDIIVLAKGMSAGLYPLATTSYKPFIEEVFEEDPFLHISTTGGSELGCYVTRRMLEIITEPSFLANVKKTGDLLGTTLNKYHEQYPDQVVDVRGRGLMWGIEFSDRFLSLGFMVGMINNGILADYCGNNKNTNKLMPPLIVTEEDINEIINRLNKAMGSIIDE